MYIPLMVYFSFKEIVDILKKMEKKYIDVANGDPRAVDKKFGRHGIIVIREITKEIIKEAKKKI